MSDAAHTPQPWYREPWPWILMAGPAAAIVGGGVTLWLALSTADGLVADDYYRRGLAINRDIGRERRASEEGVSARVRIDGHTLRIELHTRGAPPEALIAQIVHPTRAVQDQRLRLLPVAPGIYQAALETAPAGRWRLVLEDARGEWRVVEEQP